MVFRFLFGEVPRRAAQSFFPVHQSSVLHPSTSTLHISRPMSRLEGKVLVAQGGGPTAVINQSVVGVTLEARKFTQVKAVYGAIHGVQGILKEDFLDLTPETTHNLEQVAQTPSSALLSTRDKPDEEYCARMFEVSAKAWHSLFLLCRRE